MLIFVYGTLKRGLSNDHVLKRMNASFLINVITTQKYPLIVADDPFPYLIDKEGRGKKVKGELYELDESKIDELDWFEGVPDLYVRGEIVVKFDTYVTVASTYFKSAPVKLDEFNFIEKYEE